MNATTTDEQVIRELMAGWIKAVSEKDTEAMLVDYSPEVVLYDCKPPYAIRGKAGIAKMWQACLPCMPRDLRPVHEDFKLVVGEDVAFAFGLARFESPSDPDSMACQSFVRVTIGYRKVDGKWKVEHEHVSLPFDPMSGMVVSIPVKS